MSLKNSSSRTPKKYSRKPRTIRPRFDLRGLHALPDGMSGKDFEWEDDPCVAAAIEQRWQRWRAAKDIIDADWRKAQLERVAEIAKLVDRDRQKILMEKVEEEDRDYFRKDQDENRKFLDAMAAASKAKANDWRKQAEARLRKATAAINADLAQRERKIFAPKLRHSVRTK
jgi:hypothetical protein